MAGRVCAENAKACTEDGKAYAEKDKTVHFDAVHSSECADEVPANFVVPAHMRPLTADPIHIPLIDLSQLDDTAGRPDVLNQIHKACCDWGFFQVLNHGVSLHALCDFRARLHDFFAMPISAKQELGLIVGDGGQGYGQGFVDPKSGTTEWKDFLIFQTHPPSIRNYSKWPPCLRDDIEQVSVQILSLSQRLLAIFSENLGLPSGAIEDAMDVLHQKILVAHYPACPRPDLAMGSCEHTDIGVITCVWQASEDVVALQVRKDGQWHSVEPYPGALVVNVSDQIEIFSNGRYKSGPHRVVLNSSKSRLSVIAFHNPPAAAVVSPAETLVDEHHPPKFNPTYFKTYAEKYFIKAV